MHKEIGKNSSNNQQRTISINTKVEKKKKTMTLQAMTLQPLSLQTMTPQTTTLQPITLQTMTLRPTSLQTMTLLPKTLQMMSLLSMMLKTKTLQKTTLQIKTTQMMMRGINFLAQPTITSLFLTKQKLQRLLGRTQSSG